MRNFLYWLAIGTALYGCPKANTNTVHTTPEKPVEEMVENKYPTENATEQVKNDKPAAREKVLKKYHVPGPGTNIYLEVVRDVETGDISEALYMETFGHERFRLKDIDCVGGPDQVIIFPEFGDIEGRPKIISKEETEFVNYINKVASLALPRNEASDELVKFLESQEVEFSGTSEATNYRCMHRSYYADEGIVSPYESATIGVFRDVIDGRVRRVNVSTLRTKLEGQVFITTDEAFSIEDVDNQIGFDKVVIYGRYNRDIGMLEEAEVFGSEDSRFEPYLEDAKFLLRTLEVPEEASRGH